MVADLLNSNVLLVKQAIARRIDKMGGPDPLNAVAGVAQKSQRDVAIENSFLALVGNRTIKLPPRLDPTVFLEKAVLQIYTWEKIHGGLPTNWGWLRFNDVEKAAKDVYQHAQAAHPQHFQFDDSYRQIAPNLLEKRDAPGRRVEIDHAMTANSVGGFNPDYIFANTGARPAVPTKW